jgi:hypothetical protein
MIKNLLTLFTLLFVVALVEAQTTILDFESAGTSTTFQHFGSTLDGTFNQVVPNPDPTGENTSSMVSNLVKPAVAEVWAGVFSNPNPGTAVDLTFNNKVAIKVWMDHIGSLSLKLENSTDGGSNWIITVPNTWSTSGKLLSLMPQYPLLRPLILRQLGILIQLSHCFLILELPEQEQM